MANIFNFIFGYFKKHEVHEIVAIHKEPKVAIITPPNSYELPIIGTIQFKPELYGYISKRIPIPILGNKVCQFILSGYDTDSTKTEFHDAISNFLSVQPDVMQAAGEHVLLYYKDICEWTDAVDPPFITDAKEIWKEVTFPADIYIGRRHSGDKKIYILLECECSWEIEHGLEIVFKEGLSVNKVGSFDGHHTNSDAYAKPKPEYENKVYISKADLFG